MQGVATACVGNTARERYFLGRTLLQEQFILSVEKKHAERYKLIGYNISEPEQVHF
jgi:hypothetical protein